MLLPISAIQAHDHGNSLINEYDKICLKKKNYFVKTVNSTKLFYILLFVVFFVLKENKKKYQEKKKG